MRIPLAKDFFKAFNSLPSSGFQAHVGPLINYLLEYRGLAPPEIQTLDENIEEFMTSVEKEVEQLRLRKHYGTDLSEEELLHGLSAVAAYNNMSFIFANVINEAQNGPSYSAYHELLKFCSPNDVFLTFNWDTLLDRALVDYGCWSPNKGYGIPFASILDSTWKSAMDDSLVVDTEIQLLKLHGSTNWLVPYTGFSSSTFEYESMVPEGDRVFLYWHSPLPYHTYRGRWRGGYAPACYEYYPPNLPASGFSEHGLDAPEGHMFVRMTPVDIFSPFGASEGEDGVASSPLLITPIRQKRYDRYTSTIESIWQQAQKSLLNAEKIIIIGYSFPDTDIRPMEMLRSTLENRRGELSIEIVDPYADGIAHRIGSEHLEKAKNVNIITMKFEDYVSHLWKDAAKMMIAAATKDEKVANWLAVVRAMYDHSVDKYLEKS